MPDTTSARPILTAIMLGMLWAHIVPAAADSHGSRAGSNPASIMAPEAGKKWETDTVLRRGMDNIASLVNSQWDEIAQARLQPSAYLELAGKVQAEIAGIVKNCRLSPASDRAFHEIIMDMDRSVELMRSPKAALRRAGALGLAQALRNYGSYFEHPGWSAPR